MVVRRAFLMVFVLGGIIFAADPPSQQLINNVGSVSCTAADELYGVAANVVNGYGIDEDGYHPFEHWDGEDGGLGMWVTTWGGGGSAANNPLGLDCSTWLLFDFDKNYNLGEMWVWNHSQWRPTLDETNRGLRKVKIHYRNNSGWTELGDFEIPQMAGAEWVAHNYELDFGGVDANSVLITAASADGNWGSPYYGMSEIMFGIDGTTYNPYSNHPAEASVPKTDITVSASSEYDEWSSGTYTINSVLNNFRHENGSYWITDGVNTPSSADPNNLVSGPAWIRYDFAAAQELGEMWLWNQNQIGELGEDLTGRGLKKVYIDYLDDLGTWHRLMDTSVVPDANHFVLNQASGAPLIEKTDVIDFGGVTATSVVITADSTDGMWGDGSDPYYGLSEVLFGIANTVWTAPGEPEVVLPAEDAIHDTRIVATASSNWPGSEPQKSVSGTGLNWDTLLHDNDAGGTTMWLSDGNTDLDSAVPGSTTVGYEWIKYDFDKAYPMGTTWIWNYNQIAGVTDLTTRSLKKVTIEYTSDGVNWSTLMDGENDYFILDQATGEGQMQYTTAIDFGGVDANSVVITADSSDAAYGGQPYIGLSEVRFGIAGTTYRGHPVVVDGDFDDDFDVDVDDLMALTSGWLENNIIPPAAGLGIEDFEAYTVASDPNLSDAWTVLPGTGLVSNAIALLTDPADAHTGSQAMRWTWEQEAEGTYAELQYTDAAGPVDVNDFDQLSFWMYRHTYNHQTMVVDLLDDQGVSVGSFWLDLFPESTVYPLNQWAHVALDLSGFTTSTLVSSLKFGVTTYIGTDPGMIDIDDIELINLAGCSAVPEVDLTGDCKVDMSDFAVLAEHWLAGTGI